MNNRSTPEISLYDGKWRDQKHILNNMFCAWNQSAVDSVNITFELLSTKICIETMPGVRWPLIISAVDCGGPTAHSALLHSLQLTQLALLWNNLCHTMTSSNSLQLLLNFLSLSISSILWQSLSSVCQQDKWHCVTCDVCTALKIRCFLVEVRQYIKSLKRPSNFIYHSPEELFTLGTCLYRAGINETNHYKTHKSDEHECFKSMN